MLPNRTLVKIASDPYVRAVVPASIAHVLSFLYNRLDGDVCRAIGDVTFKVGSASDFPELRNCAYCEERHPPEITFAPKLAAMPVPNIIGVAAHELGHAYLITQHAEHDERQCDVVAELLFDCTIGYDSNNIQVFNMGRRPRPASLPR